MINNLNMDYAQKMQRCHEYVEALEEERRKIQVFERELPLCLELVTQAIEACKRELSGTTTEYMHGAGGGQSECSEQTTSECGGGSGPVFEEFIPIKRTSLSDDEDDEHESHKMKDDKKEITSRNSSTNDDEKNNNNDKKKSDWLRSVQLWNQSPDPPQKEDHQVSAKKATVVEVKRNGSGAFQPFHKEKQPPVSSSKSNGNSQQDQQQQQKQHIASAAAAASKAGAASSTSTAETRRESEKGGQQQQQRKQRRCWSPELHRRFLHALQQLGGSHVATPKQIRELMKVDGLTNDEVKSHLQKYRLHTRRPTPAVHNNGNQQQPQFVVVGGIWVPPPPEYAAIAPSTTTPAAAEAEAANGIYSPVAAPPPPPPPQKPAVSEERGSQRCNSPAATSSSTHTTTASPVSSH